MRDATDIHLQQLIVHILDPGHANSLVLSERALPLENEQRLAAYFVTHIQNSLQDPTAKAARFVTVDEASVSGVCQAMRGGELDLVEGSRRLATQLYSTMAKDQRISAGELAVCLYQAGQGASVTRYLALLKIDPSEVFRHKTERDPHGHLYVRFEIETDVLPTTREKLQKCAFVQPLDPSPEYDMMLLDRQGPGRRLVARFFTEDFLGAELALDSRQRTDRLSKGLVIAQNQLRAALQPQEHERLRQAIDSTVTAATMNVDTWLEALPLQEEHKEHINQVVSSMLPDREFAIDATCAQHLIQKQRLRGDHDLRLERPAANYDQIVRSVELVREPGTPPYYRIVLHTEKWEEVLR